MPTPAINDEIIRRDVQGEGFQIFDNGQGTTFKSHTVFTNRMSSYYSHVKAASTSTPPTRGTVRRPTNWAHRTNRQINIPGYLYFTTPRTRSPGLFDVTEQHWTEGSYWNEFPVYSPPSVPSWMTSKAEIAALNKLLKQDIHLGNFIAEFNEVADMFSNHVTSIARGVRSFRNSRGGSRLWDAVKKTEIGGTLTDHRKIPDAWLELQYGWKPLMSDILGACHALNSEKRQPNVSVEAQSRRRFKDIVQRSGASLGSYQKVQLDIEQRVQVKLYYKLNNGMLAQVAQLGLLNPLEIIWEKTRYSFVVDWFLPVSGWLQSLTATAGWGFLAGYHNTKSEWRTDGLVGELVIPPDGRLNDSVWLTNDMGSGDFTVQGSSFTRSVYSTSPVPGLYLKNPLSSGHVANAMSLLVQAFR